MGGSMLFYYFYSTTIQRKLIFLVSHVIWQLDSKKKHMQQNIHVLFMKAR